MITREQIEKIIEERYSDYPKLLETTIQKIDNRFLLSAKVRGERKIEYIVRNPGPVADRLRRDLANYYTALGFFGGLGVDGNGNIVVNLSIDSPTQVVHPIPTDIPPTPGDADAPAEIPEENQ